ncbi:MULTISPECIES: hypothetical protein [unclassified Microbacterium]|uniref:hypothetical protein n=1 Tax=unclassified Microbacterium TaxID=2609290 RepID=UPI000D50DA6C|nr:hypothetical protein [Microbacterium sp. TPD7012]PVE96729.1 hypothetical protein DC434_04720 [Microbacterium sp. TPD7012]
MSAIKPIIREVKQSVLKGFAHAKDKLHQLADNIVKHVDDVGVRVRGQDRFDGAPGNPPIVRDRNPDWLNERLDRDDLPFWRRRMAEGDQFNYQNHHRYPQNEVTLGNGKRLDSYLPGEEIVSRKNTQLDSVRPETANSYIDELLNKYPPGTPIAGSPDVLSGQPVLEVPVQTDPIPQSVIDHANGKEPPVQIRDVLGNVYN